MELRAPRTGPASYFPDTPGQGTAISCLGLQRYTAPKPGGSTWLSMEASSSRIATPPSKAAFPIPLWQDTQRPQDVLVQKDSHCLCPDSAACWFLPATQSSGAAGGGGGGGCSSPCCAQLSGPRAA